MAFSGTGLAVTNRTADAFSGPRLDVTKLYCRVSAALSVPNLAITNRTAESWWLFMAHDWP